MPTLCFALCCSLKASWQRQWICFSTKDGIIASCKHWLLRLWQRKEVKLVVSICVYFTMMCFVYLSLTQILQFFLKEDLCLLRQPAYKRVPLMREFAFPSRKCLFCMKEGSSAREYAFPSWMSVPLMQSSNDHLSRLVTQHEDQWVSGLVTQ